MSGLKTERSPRLHSATYPSGDTAGALEVGRAGTVMALTRSQRVTLLKEIARRLAAEQWALVDVTLEQFSLPHSATWEGSEEAYVLKMAEGAADDTLLEIAQHVGFELETTRTGVDPAFWQKDCLRLFVSHLAGHREYAAQLQGALLNCAVSAFVAHSDIEPTSEWQTEIETALATCDALTALLHPKFHASNWTDQEIGFAMGRGLPVFSVRFGQDPYGFIGRFQAFEGKTKALRIWHLNCLTFCDTTSRRSVVWQARSSRCSGRRIPLPSPGSGLDTWKSSGYGTPRLTVDFAQPLKRTLKYPTPGALATA